MKNEICAAMRSKNTCTALDAGACIGFDNCPFYKGVSQYTQEARMVNDRIVKLPYERRKYISQKYYGGKLEWEGVPNDR